MLGFAFAHQSWKVAPLQSNLSGSTIRWKKCILFHTFLHYLSIFFTMEHSRKAKICDILPEKEEFGFQSFSVRTGWLVLCWTLLTCFTLMLTTMLTDKFSPSVCCKNNNLDVLTRSEWGFHRVRDNYQIFCIFMLSCARVLSVFRAIIEPLPCRGKGRVIALLQTIQICSVHIPGIPAQGMCKYRTEVSVNRGPRPQTPLTHTNYDRILNYLWAVNGENGLFVLLKNVSSRNTNSHGCICV